MTTTELYNQIRAEGVGLYVDPASGLRARGGNFTPDLRREAGARRAELEKLVEIEQLKREGILADAKAVWHRNTSRDMGFFVGVVRNAVTEDLRKRYEKIERDYLHGLADLEQVAEAYALFANSTRRRFVNRQLVGEIYVPSWGGHRKSQREIHEKFRSLDGPGDDDMRRVFRSSVTPQIEPQDDQLSRMEVYFGISRDEYMATRFEG